MRRRAASTEPWPSIAPPLRHGRTSPSRTIKWAGSTSSTAKPRDAIGEFRQATQINPDHEAAHHDLAVLLTALGRTDEAIPHYQKVLRLNPASTDTRMKLAAALAEQGRWDQAVTEYRLVLEVEPQSERAKAALTAAVAEQARQRR